MIEINNYDHSLYKNLLNDNSDTDVRFFENGNVAVAGDFTRDPEIIVVIQRKQNLSFVYATEFSITKAYEIDTHVLADFLEVDLRFLLCNDENPANIRAFVGEIESIL